MSTYVPVNPSGRCGAQEALSNAGRHAAGAPVTVSVRHHANTVTLQVANGPGVSAGPRANGHRPGHGLAGMRELTELLGGSLSAGRHPTAGSRCPRCSRSADHWHDPDGARSGGEVIRCLIADDQASCGPAKRRCPRRSVCEVSGEEARRRAAELLGGSGLTDAGDRRAGTYSGGMRQRAQPGRQPCRRARRDRSVRATPDSISPAARQCGAPSRGLTQGSGHSRNVRLMVTMGRAGFRAAQRGRGEVQQPTRLGHPEQPAACALGCEVTASRFVPVVCIQESARSRR